MKAVKYQKKSLIKLEDLLRKRKTTLKKFLSERGINTYNGLEEICGRLGVITPTYDSFNSCIPSYVSDPTNGVIVIPPFDVVNESTGDREDVHDIFEAIPPTTAYEGLESSEEEISEYEVVEAHDVSEVLKKTVSRRRMKKASGV